MTYYCKTIAILLRNSAILLTYCIIEYCNSAISQHYCYCFVQYSKKLLAVSLVYCNEIQIFKTQHNPKQREEEKTPTLSVHACSGRKDKDLRYLNYEEHRAKSIALAHCFLRVLYPKRYCFHLI